jgi:hypothetical protein
MGIERAEEAHGPRVAGVQGHDHAGHHGHDPIPQHAERRRPFLEPGRGLDPGAPDLGPGAKIPLGSGGIVSGVAVAAPGRARGVTGRAGQAGVARLGHVDEGLRRVWRGPRYQALRTSVATAGAVPAVCRTCHIADYDIVNLTFPVDRT